MAGKSYQKQIAKSSSRPVEKTGFSRKKKPKQYQTIIIGAGPAGLIAGKELKDVLILEQKKRIGKPVQCGEAISRKTLDLQGIAHNPKWISSEIYKVERIMPNGKAIGRLHQEAVGYVIDREKFEKSLAKSVRKKIKLNTEVVNLEQEGNFWKVFTKKGKIFKARYIIAADGPSSVVRRKVFPESQAKIDFVPAVEYLVKVKKEFDVCALKMYFDNEKYPEGYAWIFPKSPKLANVGIISKSNNLAKQFEEFLKQAVKKQYGACRLLQNKSGVIPVRKGNFVSYKNNVFLTGDAAALADPLFKGGMYVAMATGKMAAQCILENRPFEYEQEIKALPTANSGIFQASAIFNSLDVQTLNELGEVLEEKGMASLKTFRGILNLFSKPHLRQNAFKLLRFFSIWRKARDFLW